MSRVLLRILLFQALVLAVAATAASASVTPKKSIWGPVERHGVSQFPIYADLGAGIYQTNLSWNLAAPSRPARARDPSDPAYTWPAEIDTAVAEGRRYGIRVALQVSGTPGWANRGRSPRWVPDDPGDFADFVEAASRRYPDVRHWMIWGEPSRRDNFMPLSHEVRDRPLTRRQGRGPRLYAGLLDRAYARLKGVSRRNFVIGGNTFTTGDISPRNFIRAMRVNGRPPRMDLYGHNPFSNRRPRLSAGPLGHGFADFSDLDHLAGWIDRYLAPRGGRGRIRLFLSEFFLPTDHPNHEFNFYVSREIQASWLRSALRITRSWRRIYSLGWFSLYDDPPRASGDEVNRGLIDIRGRRKPAYFAYRRG